MSTEPPQAPRATGDPETTAPASNNPPPVASANCAEFPKACACFYNKAPLDPVNHPCKCQIFTVFLELDFYDPTELPPSETPNLSCLDKTFKKFISYPLDLQKPWVPNEDRMTGARNINSMFVTSVNIETLCQYLESNPEAVSLHDDDVHAVMQNLKNKFRPYFCELGEMCLTNKLPYDFYYTKQMCDLARSRIEDFEKNATKVSIRLTGKFLTAENVGAYTKHLDKIERRTRSYRHKFQRRQNYLRREIRATTRVLAACQRFSAIQIHRLGDQEPCECRSKEWEKGVWEKFCLPVISVPVGLRGFAPI
ncbi:hypothetical protein TWF481_005322 [Arthrobotrys musiformis]|uniref:Uncharacterized protein n=1 Tax=Arthrobotrys musiformis TaxID=47236 RepID=A0AAV9WDF4_9PEZI